MEGIDDLDYNEENNEQETVHHPQSNKITFSEDATQRSPNSTFDEEDVKLSSAERRAKRFGIEPTVKIEVTKEDWEALCSDLRIQSGLHSARCVVVKGVDGMTKFTVEKIFAAFQPYRVELVDDVTAVVMFTSKVESGAMFIEMTKSLRRIKRHRPADEDGEVLSSDDEDGQLKDEAGDDVAVVMNTDASDNRTSRADVVEVDVRDVNIPDGRWRVVTKHVPEHRFLLARYATVQEVHDYRKNRNLATVDETKKRKADGTLEDTEGYTYNWNTDDKVRPGLNIFDDDGNELEWDYEHDTRFYNGEALPDDEKVKPEDQEGAPVAVKTRGRGAKKGRFLYEMGGGSTLASDSINDTSSIAATQDDRDSDVESEPDHDPTPTLQPWDRASRLGGRLQTRSKW
ncbi:unnamed protein product [Auanema sp. JU1783]|nr:unnamed protein product [Auanema sp. JU1783]